MIMNTLLVNTQQGGIIQLKRKTNGHNTLTLNFIMIKEKQTARELSCLLFFTVYFLYPSYIDLELE